MATVDFDTEDQIDESVVRLDLDSNGMLMTPEEFDAVTDYNEEYRYELIHGVLVVNPIPREAEGDPNEELGYLLRCYKADCPESTLDKTLPERYIHLTNSRRIADRVIWAGLGRLPNSRVDVPTIAVEFVSRSKRDRRRDYQEKRREYTDVGVREYWIIDRFKRQLTVVRPGQPDQVVREDQDYTTPLLPGFPLPLAHLLQLADAWDESGQ